MLASYSFELFIANSRKYCHSQKLILRNAIIERMMLLSRSKILNTKNIKLKVKFFHVFIQQYVLYWIGYKQILFFYWNIFIFKTYWCCYLSAVILLKPFITIIKIVLQYYNNHETKKFVQTAVRWALPTRQKQERIQKFTLIF